MKKVMTVFGTRPEAIKMCPLVLELKKQRNIETIVCVTGQHRQMLKQVLEVFSIEEDYNLDIMKDNQTLFDVTTNVLNGMKEILEQVAPDLVLVHGDTTTTYATGLAAFYLHIPVGHVEAGLRTYNMDEPFPEEFNRQSVGLFAKYHFAPTQTARDQLLREGKSEDSVFVTGNTVIDALKTTVRGDYQHPELEWAEGARMILLTAHRRENLGRPLHDIFLAIRKVLDEFQDVKVIYPIHLNPYIRKVAEEAFGGCNRVHLIQPLDVIDFHNFMKHAYMIVTDSGGVQEEAPELGKPVLVIRNTTERPEGIAAGTLRLVGTDRKKVYEECRLLLTDRKLYDRMSKASNPYGDGTACEKIVHIIKESI